MTQARDPETNADVEGIVGSVVGDGQAHVDADVSVDPAAAPTSVTATEPEQATPSVRPARASTPRTKPAVTTKRAPAKRTAPARATAAAASEPAPGAEETPESAPKPVAKRAPRTAAKAKPDAVDATAGEGTADATDIADADARTPVKPVAKRAPRATKAKPEASETEPAKTEPTEALASGTEATATAAKASTAKRPARSTAPRTSTAATTATKRAPRKTAAAKTPADDTTAEPAPPTARDGDAASERADLNDATAASKSAPARKAPARKAPASGAAAKSTATKSTATKSTAPKSTTAKSGTESTTAEATTAKTAAAKNADSKSTAAKSTTAKKTTAKKTTAARAPRRAAASAASVSASSADTDSISGGAGDAAALQSAEVVDVPTAPDGADASIETTMETGGTMSTTAGDGGAVPHAQTPAEAAAFAAPATDATGTVTDHVASRVQLDHGEDAVVGGSSGPRTDEQPAPPVTKRPAAKRPAAKRPAAKRPAKSRTTGSASAAQSATPVATEVSRAPIETPPETPVDVATPQGPETTPGHDVTQHADAPQAAGGSPVDAPQQGAAEAHADAVPAAVAEPEVSAAAESAPESAEAAEGSTTAAEPTPARPAEAQAAVDVPADAGVPVSTAARPTADAHVPSANVPEGAPPALLARDLVKTFGGLRAVDGIDLTVPAGSFYGIVGPNGAGKTTTLSMVSGLLRPDSGSIRVCDIDTARKGRQAKKLMGVLPDRFRTFDRLTGRQLLHYYGVLRGLSAAVVDARAADLARAFDLTDALGRVVSDYSAGMTKKVMLAGALIHSPRVLVLDEPFESVDPVSSAVILEILRSYVAGGGTVILSSHGMDLVERVCDRVAVIVSGQVLAEGTIDEVRGDLTLEQRFVELSGGLSEVEGLEWLQTYSG